MLSTPNLLTLDNEPASIMVGKTVPFVSGQYITPGSTNSNPFQTIQREDIGLKLNIRRRYPRAARSSWTSTRKSAASTGRYRCRGRAGHQQARHGHQRAVGRRPDHGAGRPAGRQRHEQPGPGAGAGLHPGTGQSVPL
ncbi:hypothetical protein WJ970_23150 [Achromobacter xylosoxidans]